MKTTMYGRVPSKLTGAIDIVPAGEFAFSGMSVVGVLTHVDALEGKAELFFKGGPSVLVEMNADVKKIASRLLCDPWRGE